MPGELDDKPKEPIEWHYYRGLIRRHIWHFLIPFFLGWCAVWAASWFMPSIYRSGTLILVEEPTIPQEFVLPNVAGDLQSRLQSITQQILSRTRLLHIIERLNLYEGTGHPSPDELVERMRGDIKIELNRSEDGRALTSFNVYYSARQPATAQAVTSELCNLFINENLEVRQQQSQSTTDFLQSQLEAASRDLAAQERKVKEFKDHHLGALPGQTQTNLQVLSGLQAQLQNEQESLARAQQQSTYLESLINQYRTFRQQRASNSVAIPDSESADDELDSLHAQLTALLARDTEKHPDVRRLKNQIAEAERLKALPKTNLVKPHEEVPSSISSSDIDPKSPLFQLQNQLTSDNFEIANHENMIKQLQMRIAEMQSKLNAEPVLEQQLADVSRGYEESKSDYDSLLKRKNESELATNLELQQKGEHFRVLDPPNLPTKPYSPQRLKLFGVGLLVGCVLGAGVAAATEILDDRIFSQNELKRLLPVSVIVDIPPVIGRTEQTRENRGLRLRWAGVGTVLTSIVIAFAFTYYRG
jgi:polysaccharide biosynthesis transport protein